MNDRLIYELLYEFMKNGIGDSEFCLDITAEDPYYVWDAFVKSKFLADNFGEVVHLVRSIAKDINRKEKLKCQYCRIDEGFSVESPIKFEDLCKKHRQEYEEKYVDRTLAQNISPNGGRPFRDV